MNNQNDNKPAATTQQTAIIREALAKFQNYARAGKYLGLAAVQTVKKIMATLEISGNDNSAYLENWPVPKLVKDTTPKAGNEKTYRYRVLGYVQIGSDAGIGKWISKGETIYQCDKLDEALDQVVVISVDHPECLKIDIERGEWR